MISPRRLRVLVLALALALLSGSLVTTLSVARPTAARAAAATLDPNGPRGLDLDRAFTLTKGSPHAVVAYVEGGINWHLGEEARTLADHVFLNWHELPVPCSARPCRRVFGHHQKAYDVNHDGVVNVEDWAHDPRVHDTNHDGFLDPEDLLAAFRDGKDQDHNGFTDDISGWDFYDHSSDSATLDGGYPHSDDQMHDLLSQCPKCMVMPVKAGDEALDRTDDLAQAWLYADQMHVAAISSLTADLGYSSYMREAVQRIVRDGVAITESSNDFDSTDHQGGMFWPGVVPGNGALVDPSGKKLDRADETSWGTHNVLTVAGQGSTSGSTAAMGGLMGLVMSWGRHEYRDHHIPTPLTGQQAIAVMRATAHPVTDTSLPWPGAKGDWSIQYGYGIPDMYAAMKAISANRIPPVTEITSPRWYTLFDPHHRRHATVDARVTVPSPRQRWHYRLQVGLGEQPSHFTTVARGTHRGSFSGRVARLSMHHLVPRSFSDRPMTESQTKELPTAEQYAVTLRLVTDAGHHRVGMDRRAVYAHHDPTLVHGFPRRIGSSGESQPALADLTGAGREDIVYGTADGLVHALDPKTGKDIPGFPVHTRPTRPHRQYRGVHPGDEPVISDVAVGDLRGTGHEDVVATSTTGRVYAWSPHGHLLNGWPHLLRTGVPKLPIPRVNHPYTREPVMGAVASPVLAALGGGRTLDVVQAAWDGHIHAWHPSGHPVPGYPIDVRFPSSEQVPNGYDLIDDHKLDATPAIAYLDGPKQKPSIVERLQYTMTKGAGVQEVGYGFADAYTAAGHRRSGWPVRVPSVIEYYGSAQEFITEGSSSPVAADISGTGKLPDDVAISPVFSVPSIVNGSGKIVGTYGTADANVGKLFEPGYLKSIPTGQHVPDSAIAFTTSGAFGSLGGSLRYGQAESDAASLALAENENNSGRGIDESEATFPAAGGASAPGFPATRQGLNFLGSPIFADVDGSGLGDVIDGGDSNAVQAYSAAGRQVPGFPKWTTGWNVFSPSTGDLFGTGQTDLVSATREGYLFAWKTAGKASGNDQWWRWGHDEWNSGRYGTVTRPPGAPRSLRWTPGSRTASFVAPGATWYDGTVASYRVRFSGGAVQTVKPTGAAGTRMTLPVPAHARSVTVQAVNSAGLRGLPETVR